MLVCPKPVLSSSSDRAISARMTPVEAATDIVLEIGRVADVGWLRVGDVGLVGHPIMGDRDVPLIDVAVRVLFQRAAVRLVDDHGACRDVVTQVIALGVDVDHDSAADWRRRSRLDLGREQD